MRMLNWWKTSCTVCVLCATTTIALPAQTFKTLFSFDLTDGYGPSAGLVQATDGNLYGTAEVGGANGDGTVFKITPSGTLTTLYSFCAQTGCPDGADPSAGLIQATDGNFYGTTTEGGVYTTNCDNGCGTVFKITPSGTLTTLHSFCPPGCPDGFIPYAGLVQGTDGNLYGTTQYGGAYGYGTIFKITPSGKLTPLYSFCSQTPCPDGAVPWAGLVQATDGNFYGTTVEGGAYGYGTVFKITPTGTLTTLHSFDYTDGELPYAALIQATDGNFYGTTAGPPYGTVFKITPSGTLTTLHTFDMTDGEGPWTLVQATDGSLYGTTEFGGANERGTVFKVTLSGTLTTLHDFCRQRGCTDGDGPLAGLVQDTNGSFYGTTQYGGTYDDGTVFNLSVGLGPFVETQPTSGKVGAAVKILGTDLTGATSVKFNGTPAVLKVVSASEITTSVPSGATTGAVQVTIPTTPRNTLSSNVPFRVLP